MIKGFCNKLIVSILCLVFVCIPLTSCSSGKKVHQKLLTNITLIVPETNSRINFNLNKGVTAEYRTSQSEFAEHGVVSLLTDHIQSIGNNKFVTFIAVNRGGSGTEIYLAVFGFEKNISQMKGYRFLGDRIQIVSLSVDRDNNIHVAYKKHGLTQPMVDAPNVLVQKTFSYQKLVDESHERLPGSPNT